MVKKILLLLFVGFVSVAVMAQFPAPYCAEAYANGREPITNVTFSNINNSSPAATAGAPPHEDFLSVVGNVLSGTAYAISVKGNTDGNFTDYIRVFIDWNNNNVFTDAGESYDIGSIANSTGLDAIAATGAITIPAAQPAGSVRMRVTKRYSSYQEPCNTIGFGQAEDYTLTVAVPSCFAPGIPTVSAITATSATISWSAAAGVLGYQYAVTTSATPPASGTSTTATTANITGLSASTLYYAHVRAGCAGSTFSSWVTSSFTTLCVAASVPYLEDFEGITAPAVPACFAVQDLNAATTWTGFNNTGLPPIQTASSGTKSIRYSYSSTLPADDWFFMQGINLTAGTTYRLNFKYKASDGPTYVEKLEVKYGTSANAAAMTAGTLLTDNNINNALADPFRDGQADFTPTATGVYYIGFHCTSIADRGYLYIDDISVALPPSCSAPIGLAVTSATATSANLSWNAALGATGYEWLVSTSATPPASGTATAATSVIAGGLTALTQYYAHVRTACAGGLFSTWSSLPFSWVPNDSACGAIPLTLGGANQCTNTAFATSVGDPALPGSCSSPNNTVWYSYTPAANGTVTLRTEIPAATANALEGWVVWYTGSCNGTLTPVAGSACQSFGPDAGTADSLLSPVLTAGTTYYIMIDGVGGDNGEACFNLITPPPPPGCVTNISPANGATGVTVPAALISWNAAPAASSYNVFFGTTNPPTISIGSVAAPGTSVNVTGLLYSTTYYWYVTPVNAGGPATGCSTNVTSFTTQAAPPNCVPFYGTGANQNCEGGDRITLFRLKGESSELNINTGSDCNSPVAYVDSTDHPVVITMARGKSYWGQVQCGFSSNAIAIWIDFNDNGLFETTEKLMNNLVVGATLTNINLFIPLTAAVGNHRMRVRDVFSPSGPIDACALYTYGETEDYTVNIAAGGTSYAASTYASSGSCYTGVGSVTVDALSNNNSNYVPLVDSSNALVAQLYPQGNNLGRVTTSYYKHNGPVRQDAGGRYYIDRNLTITVGTQPVTPYNLRFPFLNSELNALIAQPGSGVTSVFDLTMTKNGDACLNAIGTGGTGGLVFFPTGYGSISGDRFIDVTNITGGFSSFYLHSGSTPIPVTLLDFKAQRNGNVNNLSWSTSQEVNSSHFVVERSNNGSSYTDIGKVNAVGNSSTPVNYTFSDNSPSKGVNYYRLRIVDKDNNAKNSPVRSVRNDGLADIAIYPNPVKEILTVNITADKAESGMLYITDLSGKVFYNRTLNIVQGANVLPVNISNMANGAYIIKVQLSGDILVRKINKM